MAGQLAPLSWEFVRRHCARAHPRRVPTGWMFRNNILPSHQLPDHAIFYVIYDTVHQALNNES